MKYEETLPPSTLEGIDFCLKQLYADKTHRLLDLVTDKLTYVELLQTLILAKEMVEEHMAEGKEEPGNSI